jgi:fatty acid desaturase
MTFITSILGVASIPAYIWAFIDQGFWSVSLVVVLNIVLFVAGVFDNVPEYGAPTWHDYAGSLSGLLVLPVLGFGVYSGSYLIGACCILPLLLACLFTELKKAAAE